MKIAYNITYVVDPLHVDLWRYWMINSYLPRLMESGCFESYRLHKLIGLSQEEGPTYAVQLMAINKKMLNQYQDQHESEDQDFMLHRFKDKLVEFRTTMVVVAEG